MINPSCGMFPLPYDIILGIMRRYQILSMGLMPMKKKAFSSTLLITSQRIILLCIFSSPTILYFL